MTERDDEGHSGEAAAMPAPAMTPAAQLAAWRHAGAEQCDPLRFRTLEAMLARAAAYGGAARRVLDDKLAQRIAVYAALVASQPGRCAESPARANQARDRKHSRPVPSGAPSALARLLDHLSGHEAAAGHPAPAAPATAREAGALPELKSVSQFRGTWSRLRADRSLLQSRSTMPDNAGPLNSQHLVHRSLHLMRAVSPDYLNRFIAYVDALAALEQLAHAALPTTATTAARATPPRKGRSKGA